MQLTHLAPLAGALLALAPACAGPGSEEAPSETVSIVLEPAEPDVPEEVAAESAMPMAASGPMLDDDGIFYVEGAKPTRPRVRYRDGQVSMNQSCAIQLGNKLNRRIPPVYVNGHPVGFC